MPIIKKSVIRGYLKPIRTTLIKTTRTDGWVLLKFSPVGFGFGWFKLNVSKFLFVGYAQNGADFVGYF